MKRPLGIRARLLVAALAGSVTIAACTHAFAQSEPHLPSIAGKLSYGGLERTYRLYRPDGLDLSVPIPLVLVLHGGFGTGASAEAGYHWDRVAKAHGFAVAYPDGIGFTWNAGTCCGRASKENIDDVGFLNALLTQLQREQNVDPHRIYVTGMSNGSMMTYRFACESDRALAAIGPVAGSLPDACLRAKPTSVLAIHGLDDRFAPFAGGVGLGNNRLPRGSVPAANLWWRKRDDCGALVDQTRGNVTTSIAHCPDDRAVELITIAGAGHQWPGGKPPTAREQAILKQIAGLQLDTPSTELDATETLWEFFAAHRS